MNPGKHETYDVITKLRLSKSLVRAIDSIVERDRKAQSKALVQEEITRSKVMRRLLAKGIEADAAAA